MTLESLKPEYRLALARDGYALVKCDRGVQAGGLASKKADRADNKIRFHLIARHVNLMYPLPRGSAPAPRRI